MATSTGLYLLLIAAVAVGRLAELLVSRRHEERLRARGAIEVGAGHYPAMVAVHAGLLVGAPFEVLALERPLLAPLAVAMLLLVMATTALRQWVIFTLGDRWTTRVLVLPGAPLIAGGPYRWLSHPNYLAVALEVPALALVHSAWLCALLFGAANLLVLARRLQVEEGALAPLRRETPARLARRE
jgi:methyltransferase